MEKTLDDIANGKVDYLDYMSNFYKNLKNVIDNTDEVGLTSEATEKICPKCNSSMVMRRSRFGKLFYGCSNYPKCNGIIGIN